MAQNGFVLLSSSSPSFSLLRQTMNCVLNELSRKKLYLRNRARTHNHTWIGIFKRKFHLGCPVAGWWLVPLAIGEFAILPQQKIICIFRRRRCTACQTPNALADWLSVRPRAVTHTFPFPSHFTYSRLRSPHSMCIRKCTQICGGSIASGKSNDATGAI